MASIFELMNALSRSGAAVLADASVKSAVVLLSAAITAKVMCQAPAAVRHRVWSLGLCGALLMPLLSWTVPQMRLPVLPAKAVPAKTAGESGGANSTKLPGEVAAMDSIVRDANEETRGMKAAPFPDQQFEWDVATVNPISAENLSAAQAVPLDVRVYVLSVWMAGLAMVLAPLAAGFGVNWFLLRKSRRLTQARWLRLIAELSARIGLTRTVAAFELPQPVVPMTWGLLRPMVLISEDWRDWPQERQRCVLLHELAHVKRLDVAFQIIGRLAAAVYWFNPLVWFAVRQLRIERELACDDCVLASGERASDYARELLTIAKLYRLQPLVVGVAMAHSARLDQRVLRILDQTRSRLPMSPRAARRLFVTATVLVLGVAATSLVERSTSAVEGDEEQARPKKGIVDVVSYTTNQVNAVAVSSDGKLVAGGGMDMSVRIWTLDSGNLLHRLEGSQRIIRAVAFQPRGSLLASAGDELVVRVWDVAAGAQVKTLLGLSPTVTSISFSPDGKLLAGCSFRQKGPKQWQGDVVIWDVDSGEAVRVVESQANGYYRGIAFSPDGSLLAAAFDSTGDSRSSGVKLWDSKSLEHKRTLLRDRGASLSVAFSPEGRFVASGGGYVEVNDGRMATGEVNIWEIESANMVGKLARPAGGGYVAIAFSPFGSIAGQGFGPRVETATESRVISEVTNWNPATEHPTWNVTCAFCGDPTPPAFTPDGTKLITCDSDAVRVFDAETGETRSVLMKVERSPVSSKTENRAVDKTTNTDADERAKGAAAVPTGLAERPAIGQRSLVTRIGRRGSPVAHLRDIKTGSRHAEAIAFTRDGKFMISCGHDTDPPGSIPSWQAGKAVGVLQISDVNDGTLVAAFQGTAGATFDVAVSPDKTLIATAGRVRNDPHLGEVKLWDVDSKREKMTLKGHTGWVLSVAFSPDGRLLASGGFDKVARIWDVASGELVAELPQQDGIIDVVAFGPERVGLVTATRRGVVKFWDTATWETTGGFSKPSYFVLDLGISPDGKWIATGGGLWQKIVDEKGKEREQQDALVLLHRVGVDQPPMEIEVAGSLATSVSFSSDSCLLAAKAMPSSRERPGGIMIYNIADQTQFYLPSAHHGSNDGLRFLPHGRTLATTQPSGTVSLWNLPD